MAVFKLYYSYSKLEAYNGNSQHYNHIEFIDIFKAFVHFKIVMKDFIAVCNKLRDRMS